MPSTQVWSGGAGDGNFGTAGNWVSGVAPIGGDSVVFNSGNVSVTAGLTTGISIANITVTANYGGLIGDTSGNGLVFTGITGTLTYGGTGAYARFGSSGTVAAATFSHTGACVASILSGTWTVLNNGTGMMTIAAAAVVTGFENAGGVVTAGYNATAFTTGRISGNVTSQRVFTTVDVENGGTLITRDNGTTNYNGNTTTHVHGGGYYNKQAGGADTTVNIYTGGRYDATGNSGGSTGTVTLGTIKPRPGASYKLDGYPGFATSYTLTPVGAAN